MPALSEFFSHTFLLDYLYLFSFLASRLLFLAENSSEKQNCDGQVKDKVAPYLQGHSSSSVVASDLVDLGDLVFLSSSTSMVYSLPFQCVLGHLLSLENIPLFQRDE